MVTIHSFAAAGADTASVLDDIERQVAERRITANLVFAFFGCSHDAVKIHAYLKGRFPDTALLGGTSGSGIMTDARLWGNDAIGLLAICDAEGQYGAAAVPFADDPAAAAEAALHAALAQASCPGELPALIWVYQAPGREEEAMDGLRHIVGDRCPIIGGSSADDDGSGRWHQIGPDGVLENGIAVAVLFSSGGISYAFQGGYEPAGPSGIVTRVGRDDSGKRGVHPGVRSRELVEIDGRPAALVYDEWTGNILGEKATSGGNIFEQTTMHPLAVQTGDIEGVPHYLLIHPKAVTSSGGLTTFAAIEQGTRVYSMRGNKQQLAERGGHVAAQAVAQLPDGPDSFAGGLVVYCVGCQRTVREQMPAVALGVKESFRQSPFLGCFTLGEQGCITGRNTHGNLMISAVAFGT